MKLLTLLGALAVAVIPPIAARYILGVGNLRRDMRYLRNDALLVRDSAAILASSALDAIERQYSYWYFLLRTPDKLRALRRKVEGGAYKEDTSSGSSSGNNTGDG